MVDVRPWMVILAGWVWALAALVPATNAAWPLAWKLVLVPPGLVVGSGWLWWTTHRPGALRDRWVRGLWLSVPAAVLLVHVAGTNGYGLALRVWLCENELRAFAEAARAGKEDVGANGPNDCSVGLFHIERTYGYGSEVGMVTARSLFRDYGVLYWPYASPANFGDGDNSCRHLYGPWYWFSDGL